MRHFIFVLTLFLAQLDVAHAGRTYFTGSHFDPIGSVQIIGVARDTGIVSRELHIQDVLRANQRSFQYCYDRAWHQSPIPVIEIVFYVAVNKNGKFENVTAEFENISSKLSDSGVFETTVAVHSLIRCMSTQLPRFQAVKSDADHVIRIYTTFKPRQ